MSTENSALKEINNTETTLLLRNTQLANKRLKRVEAEMADAKNETEINEIIEDNKHVADWVGLSQNELSNRLVPSSLWDAEPVDVD